MKVTFIKEPTLETYAYFIWGCNLDEFNKWVKKKFKYEMRVEDGVRARMVEVHDDTYHDWAIWTQHADLYEFLHEINHLVFSLMRYKEIPLKKATEEIFTHLQRYYLEELQKRIKTRRKQK